MNTNNYQMPKFDYYIMTRDGEMTIICIPAGNDPLYGMGSWNLKGGPYSTWEAASAATLGSKGGSVRSERKAASSRANGKLGGRPKKAQ